MPLISRKRQKVLLNLFCLLLYLVKHNFPKVSQSEGRVYIQYCPGKRGEYTAIYYSREGRRFLEFHLENPTSNILSALEKALMSEEAIKKRAENKKYSEIFSQPKFKTSSVPYKDEGGTKEVYSVVAVTEIKEIPVGQKGHLSGDFSDLVFKHIIKPFISTVEKHKNMLS